MLDSIPQYFRAFSEAIKESPPNPSLCVSLLALVIAFNNYRRKSGVLIRGDYIIQHGADCEDHFVKSITLENLKDRAVTIFSVYLRLGHNYFVLLEKFNEDPLVLKGYETYHREFGPLEFYSMQMTRVDLNELLDERTTKGRLVLSTSDGKYAVPKIIPKWDPVTDFFSNHLTGIIQPMRTNYKGESIGSRVRYVVGIVTDGGTDKVMKFHQSGYSNMSFQNFKITDEALSSKEALSNYLQEKKDAGLWSCREFTVFDMNEQRDYHVKRSGFPNKEARIIPPAINAFQYHVIGRVWSHLRDRKRKRENAARNAELIRDVPLMPDSSDEQTGSTGYANHGEE